MSAFELFSGFSENEVNYLECNLLYSVKAAFKQVLKESKLAGHLNAFLTKRNVEDL